MSLKPFTAGMTPLPSAPQNQIVLRRRGAYWMADFIGPHAARIRELFGVTMIPTAFTAAADWTVVLAEIKRLNPTVTVRVA